MAERGRLATDKATLTSYRYLRLSMAGVLALLAVAVLREWRSPSAHNPYVDNQHLLLSISAYYWTAVAPVFVAALVTLGVGMIVLKPESEIEDVLLNVTGALAPVVAFVPTPLPSNCKAAKTTGCDFPAEIVDRIDNNTFALWVAGALAFLLFGLLVRLASSPEEKERTQKQHTGVKAVRWTGVLLMAGGFLAFFLWSQFCPRSFRHHAHMTAARTLFVLIILVVLINAIAKWYENKHPEAFNINPDGAPTRRQKTLGKVTAWIYEVLAIVMVLGALSGLVAGTIGGWRYAMLFVEALVLGLFMVFWAVQTAELWNRGRRVHGSPGQVWPFVLAELGNDVRHPFAP